MISQRSCSVFKRSMARELDSITHLTFDVGWAVFD